MGRRPEDHEKIRTLLLEYINSCVLLEAGWAGARAVSHGSEARWCGGLGGWGQEEAISRAGVVEVLSAILRQAPALPPPPP